MTPFNELSLGNKIAAVALTLLAVGSAAWVFMYGRWAKVWNWVRGKR